MQIPFQLGEEYGYQDLTSALGSNQNSVGILWNSDKDPSALGQGFFIITSGGGKAKTLGHKDQRNEDGTWLYYGQVNLDSPGNRRIKQRELTALLFTARVPSSAEKRELGHSRNIYRYQGPFMASSHELVDEGDGERLRFHLIPVQTNFHPEIEVAPVADKEQEDLPTLRARLKEYQEKQRKGTTSPKEYYLRRKEVKDYALLRAEGTCECCEKPAPFSTKRGRLFLEVHHILRLADDGPDAPENVAALCPNCHREAHHGEDIVAFKEKLIRVIMEKEV
ncbi:HNH endonuclease [Verrucomicrobia bacterium]|nr:HNH endonuclease [Verrucomicrobiota bacterium]